MIFCPNKKDRDFQEMSSVLGEDKATYIWSENNGNPIHLTKEGKESKLFKDLLDLTKNRKEAILIKSKIYGEEFKNWYKEDLEPSLDGDYFINKSGSKKSIHNSGSFSSTNTNIYSDITEDSQAVNFQIVPSEAKEWLNKRGLDVSFYSDTQRIGNKIRHGYFTNGAIHLWENADGGTEFHEAFHSVFRSYLDEAKQKEIFEEAEYKYGKDLTEEELEERLAEDFAEYVMTQEKLSPLGKIGKFFADLYKYIKALITGKSNINELYSIIEANNLTKIKDGLPFKKGVSMFSNDSVANSAKVGLTEDQVVDVIDTVINVASEANKILSKSGEKIPESMILESAKQMFMDRALTNSRGKALYDLNKKYTQAEEIAIRDLQEKARNKLKAFNNNEITNVDLQMWQLQHDVYFKAIPVFEGQDQKQLSSNSSIYISLYENWEDNKDEYSNLIEKGWQNLTRRELNKGFKVSMLLDDEDLDSDEQERIFDLDAKFINRKNSLSSDVKSFLSTIESDERNFMGYKKYIPFDELYGNMVLSLANSSDLKEMITKLDKASVAKPFYSNTVKAIKELNPNMQAKIYNTFAMTYQEFKTVKQENINTGVKDINDNWIYRLETKIFDANRKKADKILLNRYRNASLEKPSDVNTAAIFKVKQEKKNKEFFDVYVPKKDKAKKYVDLYKELHTELYVNKKDYENAAKLFTEINNLLGVSFNKKQLDTYLESHNYFNKDVASIRNMFIGSKQVGLPAILNAMGDVSKTGNGKLENYEYTGDALSNDIYSEYSSYFKDVVKIEATQTNENFDSFTDDGGKSIYPIQLNTAISDSMNIIKNDKIDEILQFGKDVTFAPGKDTRYHDLWYDTFRNPRVKESIGLFDLSYYKKATEDLAQSDYSNMGEGTSWTTRLNLYLNNGNSKTNLSFLTLSDRGRMPVMELPRLEGKGGLLETQGINFNDLIRNYILQDILRLQRANKSVLPVDKGGLKEEDLIENYHYASGAKNKRDKSGSVFNRGISNQLSMLKDVEVKIGGKTKKLSQLQSSDFIKMSSPQITAIFKEQIDLVNGYIEDETTRMLDKMLELDVISGKKLEDNSYNFYTSNGKNTPNIQNVKTLLDPNAVKVFSKGADNVTDGFRQILKGFVKENLVANIQYTKWFMGDQAFSKKGSKEDAAKRIGASGTPGTKFLIQGMIESKPEFGMLREYNDSIIYDIEDTNADENISDSIRKTLKGINHPQADIIADYYVPKGKNTSKKDKDGNIIKSKGANKTDAQGWMNIDLYRHHQQGLGDWSEAKERAYKNYKSGKEFRDDNGTPIIISPIKDNHYGLQYNEITGMIEPIMIKNSYMVLLREFTKDHGRFDDLRKRMELVDEYAKGGEKNKEGTLEVIHTVNTDSTRKLSRNGIMDLNKEGYDLSQMKVNKVNSHWLRVPQVIPNDHKKPLWGSQLRKNILASLRDYFTESNYVLANGSKNKVSNLTGKQIYDLYQATGVQMIESSKNDLYDELNLHEFLRLQAKYDSNTTDFNREQLEKAKFKMFEALRDLLIEQNEERDLPDNYNKALKIIKTENGWDYSIPLSFPAFQRKFEQIIHSLFRNNVINQKINGGTAVQLSELGGLLDKDRKPVDLKFITTEGKTQNARYDTVKHAEVAIGSELAAKYNLKPGDDLSKIPEELRKIILYRIPNQGKNSSLPAIIKYVLPENYSHAIVVPGQITTQQGSDFDIDKVFIMQPNYIEQSTSGQEKYNFVGKYLKDNTKYSIDENTNKTKTNIDEIDKQEWSELDSDFERSIKKALNEFRKLGNTEYQKILPDYKNLLNKDGSINTNRLNKLSHAELENIMTDLYESILTNPNHLAELVTPLDDPELGDLAKKVKPKLGLGKPLDRNGFDTEVQLQMRNQAGKMGVALWANALSGHNIMQFGDFFVNNKYGFRYGDKILQELSPLKDITGTNKEISTNISNRLNISVDNAKDPIMYFINDNSFTFPVTNLLLRLGVDNTTVGLIMSQPIIRELTDLYQNKGYTPDKVKDAILTIGKKYNKDFKLLDETSSVNINKLESTVGTDVSNNLKDQLYLLSNFYYWNKAGRDLMKVDKILNSDRVGDMSSISAIQGFEDVENYTLKIQDSIVGLQEFKDSNVYPLANKWREVVQDTMNFSSGFFPFNTKGISYAKEGIKKVLHKEQLNKEQHDTINRAAMLHLLSDTELRDIFTKQRAEELLFSDNRNISKKLEYLSKELPELKKNAFFKMLQEDEKNYDTTNLIQRIKFENSYSYSRMEKESFTDGILQMMDSPELFTTNIPSDDILKFSNGNTVNKKKYLEKGIKSYVDDLVAYNLLSYGVNPGSGSFFDLIPTEYWERKNISKDYKDQLKNLNKYDALVDDNFIDRFIRDNWYTKGLIKTISFTEKDFKNDKYPIKENEHTFPIDDFRIKSESYNTPLGYYKVSDSKTKTDSLYRLASVSGDKVIYVKAAVMGELYKLKEQNLKDFTEGKYLPLSKSIHPENINTGVGLLNSNTYYTDNFRFDLIDDKHIKDCKVI